jgi:hypothetical protein
MRKTLLIAAAALAASVISSQAQGAVYSQNIVGYVNVPETAGGFSLEAPPLDADGTGTNNTLASLYPNAAYGDKIFVFNQASSQYGLYQYTKYTANHQSTTNWVDPSGNLASTFTINPGQSVFYNASVNETNTYVGVVLSGSLVNNNVPAAGKFNLVSSEVPLTGGITTTLGYIPNYGDKVYLFSSGSYGLYQYTKYTANHQSTTNWVDPSGNQNEPVIAVGQGFWLNPSTANTWVQVFTNN